VRRTHGMFGKPYAIKQRNIGGHIGNDIRKFLLRTSLKTLVDKVPHLINSSSTLLQKGRGKKKGGACSIHTSSPH